MAINIVSGFTPLTIEPIDSRYIATTQPWLDTEIDQYTAYHGMQVYNTSNDTLWVLTDVSAPDTEASWTEVGASNDEVGYDQIQESDGTNLTKRANLRFSDNFDITDDTDGFTLVNHSNVLDIGGVSSPADLGEVNTFGVVPDTVIAQSVPHINVVGRRDTVVNGNDFGNIAFRHQVGLTGTPSTRFTLTGTTYADGSNYNGGLEFNAFEGNNPIKVSEYHTDKVKYYIPTVYNGISTEPTGEAGMLYFDGTNFKVYENSTDGFVNITGQHSDQFADQQALEDFITNKADFRSDIGAGTSNFDGAYSSLTGSPEIALTLTGTDNDVTINTNTTAADIRDAIGAGTGTFSLPAAPTNDSFLIYDVSDSQAEYATIGSRLQHSSGFINVNQDASYTWTTNHQFQESDGTAGITINRNGTGGDNLDIGSVNFQATGPNAFPVPSSYAEIVGRTIDNDNRTGALHFNVSEGLGDNVTYLSLYASSDGTEGDVTISKPLKLNGLGGTGTHLTIDSEGVVTRTNIGDNDTTYTAGDGIDIDGDNDNSISVKLSDQLQIDSSGDINPRFIHGDTTNATNANASGLDSIAVGPNANAEGDESVAIGHSSNAEGNSTIAIGFGAGVPSSSLSNTIVIGHGASSLHSNAVAIGHTASTTADNAITLGSNTQRPEAARAVQSGDPGLTLATKDYVDNASADTEEIQDIVGAMVAGNTETNIAVTYDDDNGKLDFAVDNDLANYSNSNTNYITNAAIATWAQAGDTTQIPADKIHVSAFEVHTFNGTFMDDGEGDPYLLANVLTDGTTYNDGDLYVLIPGGGEYLYVGTDGSVGPTVAADWQQIAGLSYSGQDGIQVNGSVISLGQYLTLSGTDNNVVEFQRTNTTGELSDLVSEGPTVSTFKLDEAGSDNFNYYIGTPFPSEYALVLATADDLTSGLTDQDWADASQIRAFGSDHKTFFFGSATPVAGETHYVYIQESAQNPLVYAYYEVTIDSDDASGYTIATVNETISSNGNAPDVANNDNGIFTDELIVNTSTTRGGNGGVSLSDGENDHEYVKERTSVTSHDNDGPRGRYELWVKNTDNDNKVLGTNDLRVQIDGSGTRLTDLDAGFVKSNSSGLLSSADIVESDVPALPISKITDLQTELDGKQDTIGAGGLDPDRIAQDGATDGQVLKWNGTQWAPGTDNSGDAASETTIEDEGSIVGAATDAPVINFTGAGVYVTQDSDGTFNVHISGEAQENPSLNSLSRSFTSNNFSGTYPVTITPNITANGNTINSVTYTSSSGGFSGSVVVTSSDDANFRLVSQDVTWDSYNGIETIQAVLNYTPPGGSATDLASVSTSLTLNKTLPGTQNFIIGSSGFEYTPASSSVEYFDSGTLTTRTSFTASNGWTAGALTYDPTDASDGSWTISTNDNDLSLDVTATFTGDTNDPQTLTNRKVNNDNYQRIRSIRYGTTTNESFTAAEIQDLSTWGDDLDFRNTNPNGDTISFTIANGERIYLLYDANLGDITNITDDNGFNVTDSLVKRTDAAGMKQYTSATLAAGTLTYTITL